MREKSKYFKRNKSSREFVFKSFILLQHMFLVFYVIFRKQKILFPEDDIKHRKDVLEKNK